MPDMAGFWLFFGTKQAFAAIILYVSCGKNVKYYFKSTRNRKNGQTDDAH